MKLKNLILLVVIFSFPLTGIGVTDVRAAGNSASANASRTSSGIGAYFQDLFHGVFGMFSPTQNYSDSLTANMVEAKQPESVTIHARIAQSENSALPGFFQITIHANRFEQTVAGGHWMRIIRQTDSAGNVTAQGTLTGRVTGGTVVLSENGRVTGISGVELTITGGTGDYAGISDGTGTLGGTIRPMDEPPADGSGQPAPPFSGTLDMDF